MVQSVTGSNLLAVFPASAAARNLAQQNLVLPSPLPSPQEQAQQRASSLVRFNAPTLSNSTLATLQDNALRSQVAPELNGSNTAADSDSASRAAQAYSLAANSLRPLIALGTAPGPVPNLQALAPGAAGQGRDSGEGRETVIRSGDKAAAAGNDEARREPAQATGTREQQNPLLAPRRENFAPTATTSGTGATLGVRVDVGV